MDKRPIGVFDSGVGGLTVLKELKREIANENYIYIGDTANFPYGSKSKAEVIDLSTKIIEKLIGMDVKMIVIACGTITSQALYEMKEIFNIPIIGIIEPTVKYLKEKGIKNIGVVATTGTIRSNGWQKEIEKHIADAKVKNKACPLLAPMAEEGWTENEIAKLAIHEYLKDMKNIEALILGCTHYPLFSNFIANELGSNVEVINTGAMVAKEVKQYLIENCLANDIDNNATTQIYATDLEGGFASVARKFMNDENLSINKITLK